jgi:hypothetical protein
LWPTKPSIDDALTIPAVCTDGDHPVRAAIGATRDSRQRASLKARRVEVAGVAPQNGALHGFRDPLRKNFIIFSTVWLFATFAHSAFAHLLHARPLQRLAEDIAAACWLQSIDDGLLLLGQPLQQGLAVFDLTRGSRQQSMWRSISLSLTVEICASTSPRIQFQGNLLGRISGRRRRRCAIGRLGANYDR